MWGRVTLEGDITIARVPEFIEDLRIALKVWDEIVLDIKNLNKLDVAALQMLLATVKECEKMGRNLPSRKVLYLRV